MIDRRKGYGGERKGQDAIILLRRAKASLGFWVRFKLVDGFFFSTDPYERTRAATLTNVRRAIWGLTQRWGTVKRNMKRRDTSQKRFKRRRFLLKIYFPK